MGVVDDDDLVTRSLDVDVHDRFTWKAVSVYGGLEREECRQVWSPSSALMTK